MKRTRVPRGLGRVAIIGCGAVGEAFARLLVGAGSDVVLWSRSPSRVRALRERIGKGRGTGTVGQVRTAGRVERAAEGASLVIFAVKDDALAKVARGLAGGGLFGASSRGAVALSTSGWYGADPLVHLQKKGWAVGMLHPMRAVTSPGGKRTTGPSAALEGGIFTLEGDKAAMTVARRIVRLTGGRAITLAEGGRHAYHAAASLLSGGIVALHAEALRLLEGAISGGGGEGGTGKDAVRALDALLASTIDNLGREGAARALTGPGARGDAGVVAGHVEALGELDSDTADLYRALVRSMVRLARGRGGLNAAGARRVLAAIEPPTEE